MWEDTRSVAVNSGILPLIRFGRASFTFKLVPLVNCLSMLVILPSTQQSETVFFTAFLEIYHPIMTFLFDLVCLLTFPNVCSLFHTIYTAELFPINMAVFTGMYSVEYLGGHLS